jgi:hypothetical protein
MAQELFREGAEIGEVHGGSLASADPVETVMQIAAGSLLPRALHVVAELGIADQIEDRPRSVAEVAANADVHPDALARTLRLLAAYGVFDIRDGSVRHTASSSLLRSDHPRSLRPLARMFGLPINVEAYRLFGETLRAGRPAIEQAHAGGVFGYLAARPEEARIFDAAMTAKAQSHIAGILDAYDFSRFRSIADIGGGRGHLLQAVLGRTAKARGVLFDLPHVVDAAKGFASDRLSLAGGDFFRDRLPASDAYLLMEVIHDWDDSKSTAILKAVRAAAPDGATLLLLENIVPDEPGPHWAKTLDVVMLAVTGGLQRTRSQYAELLSGAGFRMQRVVDVPTGISIVEAVTAPLV